MEQKAEQEVGYKSTFQRGKPGWIHGTECGVVRGTGGLVESNTLFAVARNVGV